MKIDLLQFQALQNVQRAQEEEQSRYSNPNVKRNYNLDHLARFITFTNITLIWLKSSQLKYPHLFE